MFSVDYSAWGITLWVCMSGNTVYQYVFHINYSWLDSRDDLSWHNKKKQQQQQETTKPNKTTTKNQAPKTNKQKTTTTTTTKINK